jgi:hypothetical protein
MGVPMTLSDIRQVTDLLELVADWKEDWQRRSARAQLCMELIGLSDEKLEALTSEGEALIEICRLFAATERRAA